MDLILSTPKINLLSKEEIKVLIDQCETAISDMINIGGQNTQVLKMNNFIGKLIDIYTTK